MTEAKANGNSGTVAPAPKGNGNETIKIQNGKSSKLEEAIKNANLPEKVRERLNTIVGAALLNGRTIGLRAMYDELERQKKSKIDFVVDTRSLRMLAQKDQANPVVLSFERPDSVGSKKMVNQKLNIRRTAHDQIAEKCKIPLKYYDRCLSGMPTLLAENVNGWLPVEADVRQIRSLDGNARAFLSEHFRALDNADFMLMAAGVMHKAGAEVIRADLSDNHFYLKAVAPEVRAAIKPGDEIMSGCVLSNSETGFGALKVEQFTMRMNCMNGAIGEEVFYRAHLGEKLEMGIYTPETVKKMSDAIWSQVKDQLSHVFSKKGIGEVAQMMSGAMKVSLPSPTTIVEASFDELFVTQDERRWVLDELLGSKDYTQFGWSQAITATARDHKDADRRVDMERMGHDFVSMKEKDFTEYFGELLEKKLQKPVKVTVAPVIRKVAPRRQSN